MTERPELTRELRGETFLRFYYLKEELIAFCRANGLSVSGGKQELTERIAWFLNTGAALPATRRRSIGGRGDDAPLFMDRKIGEGFTCTESYRSFFRERLGSGFTFNVAFQKWLKEHPDQTLGDAVEAYRRIREAKKTEKTEIGRQFEYNTYIRDFFADNPDASLKKAIRCWNYKKNLPDSHHYEPSDLKNAADK
jgi:hypothetical protein